MPPLRKDDNILPSASEIPGMLSNLRNPRRRRVSIGPQSEADAREHLATREQTRKDGLNIQLRRSRPTLKTHDGQRDLGPVSDLAEESLNEAQHANAEGVSEASLQARDPNTSLLTPPSSDGGVSSHSSESDREEAKRDGRMFSLLEKPRTHYDVEVVTRLIVYAGIAWLAVEGNPVLFGQLGLN